MPSRFSTDTAVRPLGGGTYEATIDPGWWIVAGPNGGYVAAILLRACTAAVSDPTRTPRSLTVHYLRPPAAGAMHVMVTAERIGRSLTSLSIRAEQDGRAVCVGLAAYATSREAVAFTEEAMPDVPPPEDSLPREMAAAAPPTPSSPAPASVDAVAAAAVAAEPSPLASATAGPLAVPGPPAIPQPPMVERYDLRWAYGVQPGAGGGEARAGGWLRLADPEAVDHHVLAAYTDAWLPPLFSRLSAAMAVPTVDLTIHFRSLPVDPFDWSFGCFTSPTAADGYLVEHGQIWSRQGLLLAESRQLAVLI